MKRFFKWVPFLMLCFVPIMCASCNGCGGPAGKYEYQNMTGRTGSFTIVRVDKHLTFPVVEVLEHKPQQMAWYVEYQDKEGKRKEFYWQGEVLFEPAQLSYRYRPNKSYQSNYWNKN